MSQDHRTNPRSSRRHSCRPADRVAFSVLLLLSAVQAGATLDDGTGHYTYTSGTNENVRVDLEFVSSANPDYFRQNQYTLVPNLGFASGAPGVFSAVTLGPGSPDAGGPLSLLNDGTAPATLADLPAGSVFSTSGTYGLLLDLGAIQPINDITTYSASADGLGTGAGQNYQVWGSAILLPLVNGVDPYVNGWTRLAIGATYGNWSGLFDGAFGVHLTAYSGNLGDFQYILFGMQDIGMTEVQGARAMFSEISVGVIPEPASCAMLTGAALLGLALLRRRRG